jgi:hypothetical protein
MDDASVAPKAVKQPTRHRICRARMEPGNATVLVTDNGVDV